ncbi:reverse transcriptase domain-containing protein [Sphingomonas sp. MG17]|uniref:Reverse transcriptase domain-containing protein n=1 Tax=Sphingomonas tagetis TaxID=2949092 RepID=A0A9X2HJ01_9SPHN|nr:reverse transcriptase domain-containing protein [Sphingomonas tagetis]MCP3728854.1 reverse transcriptase domain-containing protein [Sphingomonas tagetis]
MLNLIDLLEHIQVLREQDQYYNEHYLRDLFRSKIAKSHATGKDGVRIGAFETRLIEETRLIQRKVAAETYSFTHFKERLIPRGAKRLPRQISIPTVRDRLTLRATCQLLHEHVPGTRGKTPHALIKAIVEKIRDGDQSDNVFLRLDVRDFFPSVSHKLMQRELRRVGVTPSVQRLCMDALENPTGAENELQSRGIPQGLSISGALAALYMQRFDEQQSTPQHPYFRYVDDILFICPAKVADELLKSVSRKLSARGLKVHPKGVAGKTEISPVSGGIDFLGYRVGVDQVSIRDSSYKRMFTNLQSVLTDFRYRKDIRRTIFRVNLKITGCIVDGRRRGWMMFFSYTECISQLKYLDVFLANQLSRIDFPHAQRIAIKSFVKSYHEIRFNINNTSYIPNYDAFDQTQMIEVISTMTGRRTEELVTWDIDRISSEFGRIISHEVQDLERDVGSPS